LHQSNFGTSTGEAKATTGHISGDILAAILLFPSLSGFFGNWGRNKAHAAADLDPARVAAILSLHRIVHTGESGHRRDQQDCQRQQRRSRRRFCLL
jgi:hypothetical protein